MEQTKVNIMAETAQHLINMIQKRLNSRINALNALQLSPMDKVPDEVKKMREVESSIIRAVMQEQSDLIEIISILFPNVEVAVNIILPKEKAKAKPRTKNAKK